VTEQQAEQATQATPAAAAGTTATPSSEAGTTQPTRTAEQVEAEWQSRHTALGRQHAAEVQSLKDQLAAAQASQQSATTNSAEAGNEVEALKRQLAEAQKAQQTQAQQYATELRTTKYPYAAEALDPQSLASMDEAKLAGLNARLAPQTSRPGAGIDPSTPPRDTAQKPISEKTAAELKAEILALGRGR
jgi:hypothetical protein